MQTPGSIRGARADRGRLGGHEERRRPWWTLVAALPLTAAAGITGLQVLPAGPVGSPGRETAATALARTNLPARSTTTSPTTSSANKPSAASTTSSTTTTSQAPTASANKLAAAGPSTGHPVGTWSAQYGSLAWTTGAPATTSAGALVITAAGTHAVAVQSGSPATGGLVGVSPGQLVTASAQVQAQGAAVTVEPFVLFYSSSGNLVDMVWGQYATAPAGSWGSPAPVVGLAPNGAASAALGFIAYSSSAGQQVDLQLPSFTAVTDPGGRKVTGPLHTSGTSLIDGTGHRLVLRSMQLDGLEWSSTASTVTQAAVLQMKAWGANAVRVPLGSQLWLSSSCHYDSAYANAVDSVVQWITGAGMVAVLDLDFSQPGTCAAPNGQVMADAPGSVTFWSQVAARYKGNPLVVFDLYNEPHDISDAVWLSGGAVTDPTTGVSFTAAGMQQLYNAVRQAGATNVVLVSGNTWANDPPSTLVSGRNIVYGAHIYTCPSAPPPASSCNSAGTNPVPMLSPWATFASASSVPVMVSEFGWPSTTDGTYNQNLVAYAESEGWSWNAFAYSTIAPWGLVAQVAAGTAEPDPSGMPILADLGRHLP